MIYTNFNQTTGVTDPVVIYGWLYTTGVPIQPLYNGHEQTLTPITATASAWSRTPSPWTAAPTPSPTS